MTKSFLLICLVSITLLVAAFFKQPYWYYQCVHWIISGAAIFSAWHAYRSKKIAFAFIFSAFAVAFNPIIPIHFHRSIWAIVDLVAAAIFAVSIFWLKGLAATGLNIDAVNTANPNPTTSAPQKEVNATDLPPEFLHQFAQDHLASLWDDIESAHSSDTEHNLKSCIDGEDFLELEMDEQVALLTEVGAFLGSQKPLNIEFVDSYKILVLNLKLPKRIEKSLLLVVENASVAISVKVQLQAQNEEMKRKPLPRPTKPKESTS